MSKSDVWRDALRLHFREFYGETGKGYMSHWELEWSIHGERGNAYARVVRRKWTPAAFGGYPYKFTPGFWFTLGVFKFSFREMRRALNQQRLRAYIHEEIVTQTIAGPE